MRSHCALVKSTTEKVNFVLYCRQFQSIEPSDARVLDDSPCLSNCAPVIGGMIWYIHQAVRTLGHLHGSPSLVAGTDHRVEMLGVQFHVGYTSL